MTAALNYDDLKDAISRVYPTLPKQLQLIARFALDKPNELALGTVAGVAEAAGVQPSALIRFANALEFGGFSEMQGVFREHLIERSVSYRERIDQLRRHGKPNGAGAGVLHEFVGEAVAELGHLEENVSEATLTTAAKLISTARRVHVLGQRRAFPVASYLAYALSQLELKTFLIDGLGGMLANSLNNVEPEDVLLVASFHSYSQEVIDAADAAHARGVPVIAITDSALSPLKPSSRVCFELSLGSEKAFRSLVAPLCLAQALVVSTGHRLTEQSTRSAPPAAKAKRAKNGKGAR
ncbi:MAG: MurR/RpiR family transcriptional regulator [Cytophagales bacterium]|nr:MurR/RpiR family transcriptional regulator [Rhizobacter sp.]